MVFEINKVGAVNAEPEDVPQSDMPIGGTRSRSRERGIGLIYPTKCAILGRNSVC
jgi:hypothetical protein